MSGQGAYEPEVPGSNSGGGQELVEGEAPPSKNPKVCSYWLEHSERTTLPSIAGLLEIFTKAQLDKLGRWSEGAQSDAYIRMVYAIVRMIQMEVGKALRGKDAFSRLLEGMHPRDEGVAEEPWVRQRPGQGALIDDLGKPSGQWHSMWSEPRAEKDLPPDFNPADQLLLNLGPAEPREGEMEPEPVSWGEVGGIPRPEGGTRAPEFETLGASEDLEIGDFPKTLDPLNVPQAEECPEAADKPMEAPNLEGDGMSVEDKGCSAPGSARAGKTTELGGSAPRSKEPHGPAETQTSRKYYVVFEKGR